MTGADPKFNGHDKPGLSGPKGQNFGWAGANSRGFHIGDAAANFVCNKQHTKFAAASKLLVQTNF